MELARYKFFEAVFTDVIGEKNIPILYQAFVEETDDDELNLVAASMKKILKTVELEGNERIPAALREEQFSFFLEYYTPQNALIFFTHCDFDGVIDIGINSEILALSVKQGGFFEIGIYSQTHSEEDPFSMRKLDELIDLCGQKQFTGVEIKFDFDICQLVDGMAKAQEYEQRMGCELMSLHMETKIIFFLSRPDE